METLDAIYSRRSIKHFDPEHTFTPEEERVQVIEYKIEDLKNYLIESIGNTKRNLEIKYAKLSQDIEGAEKVFIGMPGKEKNLKSCT